MPTLLTDRIDSHWTQALGLTSSRPLIEAWQQLERATDEINAGKERWQVIQWPTGTGKTEALKILCSMQDQLQHPGVLIVTKFRLEADRLATAINGLAGWRMARSVHRKAPGNLNELAFVPVLVTTHAAYKLTLEELADTGLASKSDRLLTYGAGKRAWLIIDEAFDWTDILSLNMGSLRAMSGDLAGAMQGMLRNTAERLLNLLSRLTDVEQNGRSDRVLGTEYFGILATIDILGLREAVLATPDDMLAKWTERKPATNIELEIRTERPSKTQYLELLAQLIKLVRIGHGWTSRRGGRTLLHSSRSLLGVDGMHGIIFDATAAIDPTYSVMGSRVELLPRPLGMRNYQHATLHVSYGHKVGKEHLTHHAPKAWATIWDDLSRTLIGQSILVCAHKDVLTTIEQHSAPNGYVHFDSWGNLDGKNDWDNCESAILFGLPYLDDIVPAQTFVAHQGQQSDDWFGGQRKYEFHPDIRTALGDGFIARSVVQAINRIQCRKTIDADGNCKSTDIYLLLPMGKTGEAVISAIQQQMPGIRIVDWQTGATKRKARKVPTAQKLVSFFATADPGHYSKSNIVSTLRINPSSLERVTAKLRQESSAPAQRLSACGVRFYTQTGRGREAYFIKH